MARQIAPEQKHGGACLKAQFPGFLWRGRPLALDHIPQQALALQQVPRVAQQRFAVALGGLLREDFVHGVAHGAGDDVVVLRFQQIAHAGILDGFIDIVEIAVSGEENDAAARPARQHIFHQHQARHLRHADVAEQDIHARPLEQALGLHAAEGAVAFQLRQRVLQQLVQPIHNVVLIVHNQQVHVRPPPRFLPPRSNERIRIARPAPSA